jgi:hypothetical protein
MSGIGGMYLAAETAEWLTAAGTLGAVVVAVGLQGWQSWRSRRRRPSLSLSFDNERDRVDVPPQRPASPEQKPDFYCSHWVRPQVRNERGRNSAEDVEVILVSVRAEPDGPESSPPVADERLLEGSALKWSEVDSAKVSLPPGVARHFDLVHVDNMIVEADGDDLEGRSPIRFDVHPVPAAKYYRAFKQRYKVTVALTARDTDAILYSTVIEYDLKRRDDPAAMRRALGVAAFIPHRDRLDHRPRVRLVRDQDP